MELKDLIGERVLTGVDTGNDPPDRYGDSSAYILFILDGVTYKATEDRDDGYRSYLRELQIVDEKVSNIFPPQRLIAEYSSESGHDSREDMLILKNPVTNQPCLILGTDDMDDYYPCCIMTWHPQNLPINNML